ncbi:MAG: nucleotidyltransferase family protein [Planctomycetota bacterium]
MPEPVQSKADVIDILQANAARIRELGVRRIGLFGSFVRDEPDPDSDVDVFVEFEPEKETYRNFMDLAFLLEDSFGRRIELVTPESLSPFIGPHILEEVEDVPLAA